MNRKQRLMHAYRMIASKAVDAHMEYKIVFVLSAVIIAMKESGCKVKYENFLKKFAEIYPQVLKEPDKMMRTAEDIAGMELEIHWEAADESTDSM